MKRLWPILCCLLLVLLGIGIPLAYRQGRQHESEVGHAFMDLIQGQDDLRMLQALRSGHPDEATKQLEARVWDVILPVHHYQDLLRENYWDPQEVDTFLNDASAQFRNHPIVLGGVISEEEALHRVKTSSTTNTVADPALSESFRSLSRTVAQASREKHDETRAVVLKYLKNQEEPQPEN